MKPVTVTPIEGALDADVTVPGSKSITNRALVAAALARGRSILRDIGLSDDTQAMIAALRLFGVDVEIVGADAIVNGTGGSLSRPDRVIDARQSGTTARFVLPLLLISGGGTIDGHPQLRSRPMDPQVRALRELGAHVDGESLPITVVVPGPASRRTEIEADISSQFISGLMLAGPCLPDGLELILNGNPVSQPYIDMTASVMAEFGVEIERGERRIAVAPGGYSATDHTVEPDASTATYPLAAAAMVGGRVRIAGLGASSVQGDIAFADVLARMGADVHVDEASIQVRGSGTVIPVGVDLGPMSDTAPTFAVLAARADGSSSAYGIGFIRNTKESDRVAASVAELRRLGVQATIDEDGFTVVGGPHTHAEVETYDDHRMAMAFALLGLVHEPVSIKDPGVVAKTFPGFFEMLAQLRRSARTTPLVLAIDGPAGSGKSTVAAEVAAALRLPHLDTGAMYRSVTLAVLEHRVELDDETAVEAAAADAEIYIGPEVVTLDGVDVTTAIRSDAVTQAVSPVAAVGPVRTILAARQRQWARARGAAVVEGRDIGSAVFPEATLKVFLTASVAERARRRSAETGSDDVPAMMRRIEERDRIDSQRAHDPLTIADDAVVIDSTGLEVDDVVARIVSLWEERAPA